MPLDKNMSHSEMVAELMKSFKKNGKIGATKPRDEKHALEIANAIAYNLKGTDEKIKERFEEMSLTELLDRFDEYLTAEEKRLGIVNEIKVHKAPQGDLIFKLAKQLKDKNIVGFHYDWKEKVYEIEDNETGDILFRGKPKATIDWLVSQGAKMPVKPVSLYGFNDETGWKDLNTEYNKDWNSRIVPAMMRNEALTAGGGKIEVFNLFLDTKTKLTPDEFWDGKYFDKNDKFKGKYTFNQLDKLVRKSDDFRKLFKELGIEDELNEAYEWKGPIAKVTFDNGETIETEINGTDDEIKNYYSVGKQFNLGGPNGTDKMARVKSVEVTRNVSETEEEVTDLTFEFSYDNPDNHSEADKLYGELTITRHENGSFSWIETTNNEHSEPFGDAIAAFEDAVYNGHYILSDLDGFELEDDKDNIYKALEKLDRGEESLDEISDELANKVAKERQARKPLYVGKDVSWQEYEDANKKSKRNRKLNTQRIVRQKGLQKLKSDIENKIKEVLYDDDDFVLEFEKIPEYNAIKVEVRADYGYEVMDNLADALDVIIKEYDKDAYFDHEDGGIINAVLELPVSECMQKATKVYNRRKINASKAGHDVAMGKISVDQANKIFDKEEKNTKLMKRRRAKKDKQESKINEISDELVNNAYAKSGQRLAIKARQSLKEPNNKKVSKELKSLEGKHNKFGALRISRYIRKNWSGKQESADSSAMGTEPIKPVSLVKSDKKLNEKSKCLKREFKINQNK